MKIREKLFLLMSVTIIVLTIIFNSSVLNLLSGQYEQEKLESSYDTVKHVLISYSYAAEDISRFVYESCRGESTAGFLSGIQSNPSISLNRILKSLASNQNAIVTGAFVSADGMIYEMDSSERTAKLIECWRNGFFNTDSSNQWIYTNEGRVYLKMNIYRPFPYEMVGCGLFEIDSTYLRSVTGMDNLKIGNLCIIDRYGDFRLAGENADIRFFGELVEMLRVGEKLGSEITVDGEKYYIITANSTVGKEKAIYAVSEKELLAPYRRVETATKNVAAAIVALAGVLSFILAHLFTKSIRTLKQQINAITADNDRNAKIKIAGKRDEIGELTNDFNRLLDRIDNLHEMNLKENEERQNARYEMLEWQYRALQSQVSPHFLCNILSSISMLSAVGNPKSVQSLAVDASKYLRRNLDCCSRKNNTIAEEMIISEEYVRLASAMSAVPIILDVQCPPELDSMKIPCYLLQPLVENCIKHGMPPSSSPEFRISITVGRTASDTIEISVSDNGKGFDDSLIGNVTGGQGAEKYLSGAISFGLEGIIRRLTLQYSSHFNFALRNLPGGGASVRIEIPIDRIII